jgi:hypothetical protein
MESAGAALYERRHGEIREIGLVGLARSRNRLSRVPAMRKKIGANRLKRPRYFAGKLLTPEDLNGEQEYFLERSRRHNRCLHGYGVVSGLEVACKDSVVTVTPGMALDGFGNEIIVDRRFELRLERRAPAAYVVARYVEREIDPVPTPGSNGAVVQNSRIEEDFAIAIEPEKENARRGHIDARGVVLARLLFKRNQWKVDRTFRRLKAR